MKRIILLSTWIVLFIGCTTNREKPFVFLVMDKPVLKDGLYFNKSDPSVLVQTHSREVMRYFAELDTNKREKLDYQKAYKIYQDRYIDSFTELFPSDLTESHSGKGSAIVIDTIRKTAYKTEFQPTFRVP